MIEKQMRRHASTIRFVCLFYVFVIACAFLWLEDKRRAYDYQAPCSILGELPILVKPDFSSIVSSVERKQAFFAYFELLVDYENDQISQQRYHLKQLTEWAKVGITPPVQCMQLLADLRERYRIADEASPEQALTELLLRVDEVPAALAMVQAAIESGWGQSRFAQQANNFFGQWCFKAGCGLVPLQREEGRYHEVAVFTSPRQSLRAYMLNLNSFSAYSEFRLLRAKLRQNNEPLKALSLSTALSKYSERGQDYIEQVQAMIRANGLE
ncbi:glucosaminidase domain-containing protein [Agaribacterium sp. ZY112]|uniref:glucosaminidase domain-containing protein n=1 Tax=Agaribacterium sp. ZY112 TaxID=3233574 RepID=UPI0035269732